MDNGNTQLTDLEHKLSGEITKLIFTSDDGGYSVIRVKTDTGEETAVGAFSGAYEGQHVEMTGFWEKHREFGRQFRANSVKFTLPKTPEGIKKYLASGLIPGIGEKLAEAIVKHFGINALNILDNYSSRLLEVPGFGKKRLQAIRDAWTANSAKREIFVFLQSLGIGIGHAQKIYKTYEANTPAIIKENPYRLADEIHGIGFLTADRIAASLGISKDNIFRLSSGVKYTLQKLSEDGHVCYPEEKLINEAKEILKVDENAVKKGIDEAIAKEFIKRIEIAENGDSHKMLYLNYLETAERGVALALKRLWNVRKHYGQAIGQINSFITQKGICLNNEQVQAIENVKNYPLSIITGGPGVGKTTVTSEIVRLAKFAKLKVYLCAPTGRAAKRLSEACNYPASTIHRLLHWQADKKAFAYNEHHPLNCDLLIVDEVSMLDIQLAFYLFRAVAAGTTVVLIGDADQLPSVGPGNFLADIIQSGLFPFTKLTQIYRQLSGSRIITNAHKINSGQMPDIEPVKKNEKTDFYWIECDDPEEVLSLITEIVVTRIPKRFGFDRMRDIQVLTPMNKGDCGAQKLNKVLQEKLNPHEHNKPQFYFGETIFRTGDRVMQVSNNYDKSVFNGEMGRISYIDHAEKKFKVMFECFEVEYEFVEADQIVHCYATTIHKAQGCEFPAVVVPILTQHYIMLRRNLVYTAITRARKLLVMIGSKKALAIAVKNFRVEPRYSLLKERLLDKIRLGKAMLDF